MDVWCLCVYVRFSVFVYKYRPCDEGEKSLHIPTLSHIQAFWCPWPQHQVLSAVMLCIIIFININFFPECSLNNAIYLVESL
jgi:hypothetical protein